jgi:hypothetical protein
MRFGLVPAIRLLGRSETSIRKMPALRAERRRLLALSTWRNRRGGRRWVIDLGQYTPGMSSNSCVMPMRHTELQPGQQAPATGRYQALNVFGSPDKIICIRAGERLPDLPRGFTWQYLPPGGVTVRGR